jgi:hypothetical protein
VTATIHISTTAARKAAWVRESRAEGKRLGDWIIERVEASMHKVVPISIPPDLSFADLKLARDPRTGDVSFDTAVISSIEAASGLPDGYFLGQPEDALAALLTQWYRSHLADGGAPDLVQEDLIAEARLEDERGGGLSHAPGLA